jgi:hypothetical protein
MILPRIITSVIGRHLVNPATGKVRRVTYHSVRRPGLEPRESDDPVARIRAYTTSGVGPQETAAEAPTPASGTCRRGSAARGGEAGTRSRGRTGICTGGGSLCAAAAGPLRGFLARHSDYDWLISSQSRMGKSSGGTRIWMLLATRVDAE